MPTYSYACTACDHRFDARQSFSDDALTECPQCSGRLRKLFNAVGVVFKGSGFYRTDSRSSSTATPSGGSSDGSSGASSSGGSSGSSGDSSSGASGGSTSGSSTGGTSSGGTSSSSSSSAEAPAAAG
nr:FmdB family zinc ribbon protein [Actinotalea sp. Marseille-Q4924]